MKFIQMKLWLSSQFDDFIAAEKKERRLATKQQVIAELIKEKIIENGGKITKESKAVLDKGTMRRW